MRGATEKTMIRNLTEGSIPKLLLSFAAPLLVSNALQAIYNLVDMIVVGQALGGVGMSAVSIGGDVLHFLTFVAMGFCNAGQILIARMVGEGRETELRRMIGTMFTVLLGISLLMSVVCLFLRDGILTVLNTPPEAYADAMDYTVTCMAGLVFIYGYNVVSAILRGMGDSRRPFLFIAIAAVLNTILDVLFVMVFRMGVFGAALATVIGQGVSFVFSLFYLYRRKESFHFDFRPESFRIDRESCRALVKLGIPMAIQSGSVQFSKMVLAAWINSFGVLYAALAGIFNKLGVVVNVVASSLTTTGSAMMSQNLGAKRYDRVKGILLATAAYGVLLSSVLAFSLVFFPEATFRLFTSDAAVLSAAPVLVLPCVLNFYGAAARSPGFSLINGSGRSALNLTIALADGLLARIGLAYLLGFTAGLDCVGFWLGDALAGFVPLLVGLGFYFSGLWKKERKHA